MKTGQSSSVRRWQHLCALVDAGQPVPPDDAVWLIDAISDALDGKPLRAAFGLPARGGAGSLGAVARRAARDAKLRRVAQAHFAGLQPRAAARAMLDAAERLQRRRPGPRSPADEDLRHLIASGTLPGERQLARVLQDIQ